MGHLPEAGFRSFVMDEGELTPRERDVLVLVIRGLTNRAIALQLGISENAVRYHLKELHSKLGTDGDRGRLRRWPRRRSLFPGLGALGSIAPKVLVGSVLSAIAVAGVASAVTHADHSNDGNKTTVDIVDRKYPNGCPPYDTAAGDSILDEFARQPGGLQSGYANVQEELARLNPQFVGVAIPAGTPVRVPYDPNATCAEVDPTPPSP